MVSSSGMIRPTLTVAALRERLKELLDEAPGGAVVFDADGTLWSHDVGCMVFDFAVAQGLFLGDAWRSLRDAAQDMSVDVTRAQTANDVAQRVQRAFYQGKIGNYRMAELQVWAYAGHSETAFRRLVQEALAAGQHERGLHDPVLATAQWVRQQGGAAFIVSASPLWVVEEASRAFGFSPADIAAGVPNTRVSGGYVTIEAGMAQPLPYGPEKVSAGRRLLGARNWLAALGDSSFDMDMLRHARLAVGVGRQKGMLEQLDQLAHGFRLRLD